MPFATKTGTRMSNHFSDNSAARRFELDVNGQIAFANYERRGRDLVISHVEAPMPLRGKGAASELMTRVAELARAEQRTILPYCGYARAWMRRHPEYRDLAARAE